MNSKVWSVGADHRWGEKKPFCAHPFFLRENSKAIACGCGCYNVGTDAQLRPDSLRNERACPGHS